MKEATPLKEGGETVACRFVVPDYCKRLQIKSTHHRAFGPASGDLVRDWILEAAGKSHSDHTLGAHLDCNEFCGPMIPCPEIP
jgi:hypothetical protein